MLDDVDEEEEGMDENEAADTAAATVGEDLMDEKKMPIQMSPQWGKRKISVPRRSTKCERVLISVSN